MKAVFNSSPIIFLTKLGIIKAALDLFDRIDIPSSVYSEISQKPDASAEAVEGLIEGRRVSLLKAENERFVNALGRRLGKGEAEAIALSVETGADLVILDDHAARVEAMRLGLSVKGTLLFLQEVNKKVFMQRMGLDGRQPQTYQQIALEHDISRERVRGIVEKLKKTGQLPVYRLRLDPLIERAEKIVRSRGRKMTTSDLNTHLLCFGSQGELLKYATPFIEYLNGFPSWQKAGLNIRDGLINIDSDLNA